MQLRHLPTILMLLCSSVFTYAQYENVWVFGSGGIDFRGSNPVPFTTDTAKMDIMDEAAASICNANGELLFYTEGNTIWDRNYDTMPNGQNLIPSNILNYSEYANTTSTTQGALIVPMPDSANKYYIFSLVSKGASDTNRLLGSLIYSVVDINLNNGLGDVVPGRKGILVDAGLQEKMVSVVGDRCNIWVLTCGNDGHFRAYEITSSGVNIQPIISQVGIGNAAASQGMIAVSSNRKKIASVQAGALGASSPLGDVFSNAAVSLFDFDAASGIVSNPVTVARYFTPSAYRNPRTGSLLSGDSTAYAVCFSPDDSKLYYNISVGSFGIYQLDLSSGDSSIIQNSRTYIGLSGLVPMKLGPDGKIYFGQYIEQNSSGIKSAVIGSINAPNLAGTACQYVPNSLIINPVGPSAYVPGLPNVISVFKRDTIYETHTIVDCGVDNTQLSATDTSGWDYIWNDGSYGGFRTINTNGTYWLQYRTSPCVFHTDTFTIRLTNLSPVINVNGFELSTTQSYDTYQWYFNGNILNGATYRVYTVTENGDYTVVVSDNESGCTATSAIYKVTNVTGINSMGSLQAEIKVYPNPASNVLHVKSPVAIDVNITGIEGRLIKNVNHAQTIDVRDMAEGIYLIHIYDQKGILVKVTKLVLRHGI